MIRVNALITASCGWAVRETVNSLRRSKDVSYKIIGVDCSPSCEFLDYLDKIYEVPKAGDDGYIPKLLELCLKEKVDIIIPMLSIEINKLTENEELFHKQGTKILIPCRNSKIDIANDKFKLYQFLKEESLEFMPKTKKFDYNTIDDDLASFDYPNKSIVLKMKDECGAIGFKIINDEKAKNVNGLSAREQRNNPYISKKHLKMITDDTAGKYLYQEYLCGSEYSVISLARNGKTIYALTHLNHEMQYGTTTDCETVKCIGAEEIVKKLNSLLNLDGVIGYDFKTNEHGEIKLLEINPRPTATICIAEVAGINILELGILQKLGYCIKENLIPKYGVRLKRVYCNLYSIAGEKV